MAKTSAIERDKKRRRMATRFAARRKALKELTRDRELIEGRRPFAPAWGEPAIEAAPA